MFDKLHFIIMDLIKLLVDSADALWYFENGSTIPNTINESQKWTA